MNEKELRQIIREELVRLNEEKSPDQRRLDDARLAVVSIGTAAEMLKRAGLRSEAAADMSRQLEEMLTRLRGEVIPELESIVKGTLADRIGGVARGASSMLRGLYR